MPKARQFIFTTVALLIFIESFAQVSITDSLFCGHHVVLDKQSKLMPWAVGEKNAYDHCLRLRWNFVLTKTPYCPGPDPRSSFRQYYFYCAFKDSGNILLPDTWMNDVGEKIPMWFESARLYYQYTGDTMPLTITKGMVDYSLEHGITPADYSWSKFPQTAANAGAVEFNGFTSAKRFSEDDAQVDHAGEEPPKGFLSDEKMQPPRLRQRLHTDGEIVQQLLAGPEQVLPRVLSDHLEHSLPRV